MKFKAKLIEVCGGFHRSANHTVTLEVESLEKLRELSVYLYEDVCIEVPVDDEEHHE